MSQLLTLYGLIFVAGLLLGVITAFIVLLLHKLGIVEYVQVFGTKFLSDLFSCIFCMSFWLSLILAVVAAVVFMNFWLLLLPFFATPISYALIRNG